jgi:hypothetical protein
MYFVFRFVRAPLIGSYRSFPCLAPDWRDLLRAPFHAGLLHLHPQARPEGISVRTSATTRGGLAYDFFRFVSGSLLDRDSLDLVERNLVLSAVVKLGCPRRFVVSDLLRHFQLAAVLQIRRNAGRPKGMIANPRLDAGGFRPPADDAVSVLLEEGIGGKLAGLAAGAAEEIAVDVIGDAGRLDIIVQTLVETMMTGNVVLLAAFFV